MRHGTSVVAIAIGLLLTVLWQTALRGAGHEEPRPAPFSLTAQEVAALDDALDRWKQWNAHVRTFRCSFRSWVYNPLFGPRDRAEHVDLGVIQYAAPCSLLFRVDASEKDGQRVATDQNRAEHWVFCGTSVFEYRYDRKQRIEHALPDNLQGQAKTLVDGPLAFGFAWAAIASLFGGPPVSPFPLSADPSNLRNHYYLRLATPPNHGDEIWLEAHPRYPSDARRLTKLDVIFAARDMSPVALRINYANKSISFEFYNVRMNDPAESLDEDLLQPAVPAGWQKVGGVLLKAAQPQQTQNQGQQ
jgi:hypothetical protein